MAAAAFRSKAVVMWLFIRCLLLLPLFVGFLCMVIDLLCSTLCYVLSEFAIISLGKKELVALLLLFYECRVAVIVL